MSEEIALPTPEQELAAAQERLGAAKARMEAADKLRLQTLQAKVAAIQAEKERQAAEQRAEYDRIQQKHIDRRNKEREEEAAKQREEAARNAVLQAEIAKTEAALQTQRDHEAKLQRLAAETQALEQAAQAAQAAALADLDFIETGVATKIITPPASEDVDHQAHPLRRFFNPEVAVVPSKEGEISSEQTALAQMRLDQIAEGATPIYAQPPQPEAPKAVVEPRRKANRYVDSTVSRTLEDLLWSELKVRGNANAIDNLSATFNEIYVMAAARKAIAQFKAKPMSLDALILTIEMLADEVVPNA